MAGKKVLVVDDSEFVRSVISRRIGGDPDIEVIGVAADGIEALNKVNSLKPDVITMDVIMPEMDGLIALQHIMTECPTPVIMLSALTGEGTETAIKALELGAADFYLKSSALNPLRSGDMPNSLIEKIKVVAKIKISGSPSARLELQCLALLQRPLFSAFNHDQNRRFWGYGLHRAPRHSPVERAAS